MPDINKSYDASLFTETDADGFRRVKALAKYPKDETKHVLMYPISKGRLFTGITRPTSNFTNADVMYGYPYTEMKNGIRVAKVQVPVVENIPGCFCGDVNMSEYQWVNIKMEFTQKSWGFQARFKNAAQDFNPGMWRSYANMISNGSISYWQKVSWGGSQNNCIVGSSGGPVWCVLSDGTVISDPWASGYRYFDENPMSGQFMHYMPMLEKIGNRYRVFSCSIMDFFTYPQIALSVSLDRSNGQATTVMACLPFQSMHVAYGNAEFNQQMVHERPVYDFCNNPQTQGTLIRDFTFNGLAGGLWQNYFPNNNRFLNETVPADHQMTENGVVTDTGRIVATYEAKFHKVAPPEVENYEYPYWAYTPPWPCPGSSSDNTFRFPYEPADFPDQKCVSYWGHVYCVSNEAICSDFSNDGFAFDPACGPRDKELPPFTIGGSKGYGCGFGGVGG